METMLLQNFGGTNKEYNGTVLIVANHILKNSALNGSCGPSRNFAGHFRVSQFPLYPKNGEDLLSRQTSQSFFFLLP